jgi:uncharacterized repeat protein (TIGR03837 family)
MTQAPLWDIFCKVVDNHGDIGVCWRLARQLAAEQPVRVRLWVDDLQALKTLWPAAELKDRQSLAGVDVCRWPAKFDADVRVADAVIEAFACHLPPTYIKSMAIKRDQGQAPQWFNLEYLSAESWVEGCHGLFSPHPLTGLKKAFFFPGFSFKTGGLIREKALLETRDAFLQDPATADQWLAQQGVHRQSGSLTISLFAYENPAIGSLLRAWQLSDSAINCLVPEGRILTSINAVLTTQLKAGDQLQLGALRLVVLPFLHQDDYDRLLWSCDVNFVRGEDSFVRAHWAGKPMVWQIYPQDDDIHLVKLDAWLAQQAQISGPALTAAALTQAWNTQVDCAAEWQQAITDQRCWQQQSQAWTKHLNSFDDLASQLVYFGQKSL